MKTDQYIRICKLVETSVEYYYEFRKKRYFFEFYFTSIAGCARWLGVSYNAVKFCLRGDYTFCEGYTFEYVSEKPDERHFYIDPDKYRNPEFRKKLGLPEEGVGIYYPDK